MSFTNLPLSNAGENEVAPSDDRLLLGWLERKAQSQQTELTRSKLNELLKAAAQPRHASGNACLKLCHFMEQCKKSKSQYILEVIYSSTTCLELFDFYIDWNEKNQNRSMRQVLELLATLISSNPRKDVSLSLKKAILSRITSILCHQTSRPLAKPAFKSLECFLGKGAVTPEELVEIYEKVSTSGSDKNGDHKATRWDSLISEIFDWLTSPDVSPAAGKCLVTLLGQLRNTHQASPEFTDDHTILWQRWIRDGLVRNPDMLENVKNYLFPTLFKLDRLGSLEFLEDLNKQQPISDLNAQALNAHSLLQLAAIEVGKKAGLIEEPNILNFQNTSKKSHNVIVLREDVIGPLLGNSVDTVRSLAFSVLVSSSSTIRPFNVEALEILRSGMGILYADTDSKFRNEVLNNTKILIERIKGATAYLFRDLKKFAFVGSLNEKGIATTNSEQMERIAELERVLHDHEDFIQWFLIFLMGELIPTASYQRHITALKVVVMLLASGISTPDQRRPFVPTTKSNTVWPFTIEIFTSGAMRLLFDLMLDPFEDVRVTAASVLNFAPRHCFVPGTPIEYVGTSTLITRLSDPRSQSAMLSDTTQICVPSTTMDSDAASLQVLRNFIVQAEGISKRTGRADYADGLARAYALLFRLLYTPSDRLKLVDELVLDLERKTSIAQKDLSLAVSDFPVHGICAALSFVWESIDLAIDCGERLSAVENQNQKRWDEFQLRIVHCCSSLWFSVQEVLCNDSPEGHLLEDLEEDPSIDTKDVLSYSFRAIHESSNLMRTIINRIKDRWPNGSRVLPSEVYTGIGHLAFEQLSTLRHRGAFSTVSSTFARCCQLAQYQDPDDSPGLMIIQDWYKGAISCIFEQVSTTRRSAGIPALITGILTSNAAIPSFEDVILQLLSLAKRIVKLSEKDVTNLPQVHAINCLKEIFKSSTLGKKAEAYTAACLQLAADSLNSEIWAIRNCGLLLLRSLIDSLFGTTESKSVTEGGWDGRSIRLSYERYPSLPGLLLKLLSTDTGGSSESNTPMIGAVESVFPALDIVRRAGPPSTCRAEIYRYVSMHLGSRLWHVREIAARTLCTMLLHRDWLRDILVLIASASESSNRLHGTLLAVKFILERRLHLNRDSCSEGLEEIHSELQRPKLQNALRVGAPDVLAAFIEVYNVFAKVLLVSFKHSRQQIPKILDDVLIGKVLTDHPLEECLFRIKEHPNSIALADCMGADINAALGNAIVRRVVLFSALANDVELLQHITGHIAELNTDIALAAIGCISYAWEDHYSSEVLAGISRAYIALLLSSVSPEVCSATLNCLFETINNQLHMSALTYKPSTGDFEELREFISNSSISKLQSLMNALRDTPALSNAMIQISGVVPLFSTSIPTNGKRPHIGLYLKSWGPLLSSAGNANSDFDTRYAAASALATFYRNGHMLGVSFDDSSCLSSLFALYDTLNDDDDEIRHLGSATTASLLDRSLVPLAASAELARWMSLHFFGSPSYCWNIIRRMTGHNTYEDFETARHEISKPSSDLETAMQIDDSLFVEEEQNLFVDEVRETTLWCELFADFDLDETEGHHNEKVWQVPCTVLLDWTLQGLETLNRLLENEDGVLGWSSKPAVFAICMRIIMSANAIILRYKRLGLSDRGRSTSKDKVEIVASMLETLSLLGQDKGIHERLLYEAKGKKLQRAS